MKLKKFWSVWGALPLDPPLIPVGCIPPTSVAILGLYLRVEGFCPGWVFAQGGFCLGGVCLGGVHPYPLHAGIHPWPSVDRILDTLLWKHYLRANTKRYVFWWSHTHVPLWQPYRLQVFHNPALLKNRFILLVEFHAMKFYLFMTFCQQHWNFTKNNTFNNKKTQIFIFHGKNWILVFIENSLSYILKRL